VVLALTAAFLGARSWSAAQTLLVPNPSPSKVTISGRLSQLDQADTRDRLLDAVDPAGRDPFKMPEPPRPKEGPRPRPVVTLVPPLLRLIHFDAVSPEVLLEVEGELSGRLTVGQTFKGWAVVSISPRVVEVYKNGKTYQLSPRR
jgi:hypothetical protein